MLWLTSSGDRAASRWRAGPHRAPVPARHSCVDSHEAARRRAGPSPGWYPSSGGGRTIGCPVSACPTITQGLPGPRRMPVSTADTGSVNGTMRGPVFASRRRSSPAVRSTSSQRNDTISECRHPVSPNHPHGGCSLARHGTYARKTPRGARIARWYCPESHTTFHHLIELKGIGLLTGEVGSGKTTVCRHVAAALHPGLYRVGYVSLTTGNVLDMYKSIAWELGLPTERSRATAYRAIRAEITRRVCEAKQLPNRSSTRCGGQRRCAGSGGRGAPALGVLSAAGREQASVVLRVDDSADVQKEAELPMSRTAGSSDCRPPSAARAGRHGEG